jgi:putative transcriptional regulator
MRNTLKEHRTARGWSQGQLAEQLDVTRQTINAVETDRYDPSLPLALRAAKLFGVPVDGLFFDDWEPKERRP